MTEPAAVNGLWCASLTPLKPDGRIDCGTWVSHIRDLFGHAVSGVVLFGTSGEGPSFGVGERMRALEEVLTAGLPPGRMMLATGCASLADTVELTRHALSCGCPRSLIVPPFFWKELPEDSTFRYFADLIDAVNDARLRAYLYHIPQLSAVPIGTDTIARLARAFPIAVAGVKDSSGDLSHTLGLIRSFPDLAILSGHEPHLPELMKQGGAGTICGMANLWPELIASLLEPIVNPENESRIRSLLELIRPHSFVPALKAIRAWQSGQDSWQTVRRPLLPLTLAERQTLLQALANGGF